MNEKAPGEIGALCNQLEAENKRMLNHDSLHFNQVLSKSYSRPDS